MSNLALNTKTLQASIVSGSVVLLSGSGLTTAINLSYNIVLARFLGPQGFGHATVVYTILTLISAVTLSFQIVSAKVVAQQSSPEGKASVYRGFHRSAWVCGILTALLLLFFQRAIAVYLNLPTPVLVALLAIGVAFYVPLGSRRGYIQGCYGFRRLAINLVLEGAVRLGGSLLLILIGYGVPGVIIANSAAVAVAYLAAAPMLAGRIPNPLRFSYALREISQAMVFFAGQVLINNCDIVLVKHYFAAKEAGIYAVVAMVGRVIFSFSSAVVNTMFPLVAGTREEERRGFKIIATSLLLVLCTGSVLALGLILMPAKTWTAFFGSGFDIAGKYNLPYLLALYAVTTIVYSLSVVIIAFEMSYKIANTSWVQLSFSIALIACLGRFHSSLHEVILVQLVLMVALLVSVAVPFLVKSLAKPRTMPSACSYHPVRLIRRVSEDEVIAEFLKSDFPSAAFRKYWETLHELVAKPNLDDDDENAERRALLFSRHIALWTEIPAGTEWYEIEIDEADLGQVRVFPRAQWRKLARGEFSITEVIEGMRTHQHLLDTPFHAKIAAIGEKLQKDDPGFGAVILIGLSENAPLTVLDGNHRLAASMLVSPRSIEKLRFVCGLSPRMTECCWYNTNILTLSRYGWNVMKRTLRNPHAELMRHLYQPSEAGYAHRAGEYGYRASSAAGDKVRSRAGSVANNFTENGDRTPGESTVSIRRFPETLNARQVRLFLSELKVCLNIDCPCIVFDCSGLHQIDRPAIHLLLCCLEESMKRNGDVKLAELPAEARAILDLTGVGRLFEIFDTKAAALDSFHRLPVVAVLHDSVPNCSHQASEYTA